MTMSPQRWQPSRAGILNVYQYEDETLHFAGGRLLLRGVNGSGKSTAMNMLLPFLLEADTRRIDAAGEQTGVLKSWMLADTDETQRTGYLWIEFSRPDPDAPGGRRHHTVGCGIRAGRHTERVTTWWFSTPRRAKIEFALTERKVPRSAEGLRAELGTDAVFTSPTDYRAEIAKRFFGGADPSGYLALLHQVRNPRVGDRVDADLPRRIREALPPVPEEAVADAAQPLEDLEDHRRNLTALEQTDRALAGVLDTYRGYARRVLRAAADRAADAVGAARSALQRRGKLRTAADEADATERRLGERLTELGEERGRTAARLAGLKDTPAYRDHQALLARRDHVASLRDQAGTLDRQRARARERVDGATTRITDRRRRLDGDLHRIDAALTDLGRHGRAAATALPLPDPPVLRVRTRTDDASGSTIEAPDGDDPLAALALDPLGDAVRARREQVETVTAALGKATEAGDAAERAAAEAQAAGEQADAARARAAEAREAAEQAAERHRADVLGWVGHLAEHAAAVPPAEPDGAGGWLPEPPRPDPGGDDLRATARARVQSAAAAVGELEAVLEPTLDAAGLRVQHAAADAAAVREELTAVESAAELALPRERWQGDDPPDPALFASLVDFADDLDPARRAGLEAALQASGLLTASVQADGAVRAETGELVVLAGDPVAPNLGSVLRAALPDDAPVPAEAVAAVLAHVGLGAGSAAPLWVADDGRFGAGPLRGRHGKDAAEHVGAGARAAARQRRLDELRNQLRAAEARHAAEDATHRALGEHRRELRAFRDRIPPTAEVDEAAVAAVGATREAQRLSEHHDELRRAAAVAFRAAEEQWARAQTTAADAGLPLDATELRTISAATADAAAVLRDLPGLVGSARRSLGDWHGAVDDWDTETGVHARAAADAREAVARAGHAATELATVEASLGEEPERIAEQVAEAQQVLGGLDEDVRATQDRHTDAVGVAATARAHAENAEQEAAAAEAACREARSDLVGICEVPGLLAAARDPDEAEPDGLPSTPDTTDGAARLVAALRSAVPHPERDVGEDSLDRSLRAIRDSLGAGWDAEARRATDGAPVAVEVSGPYGRRALLDATAQVTADLRRARGLLTAKQDQALRNLLHGRVAREVATALFEARELVDRMNAILSDVTTSLGIGVKLDWRTRGDLDTATATALRLLGKDPDARTEDEDAAVRAAVAGLVDEARAADPEASYRTVIGEVLDYRRWHELRLYLRRPGRGDELLSRRSRLSEGEKKLVTYLPMAAAAAASAAAHDPHGAGAPRLVLLDDAFAKVSEDNHARLFGLLVSLDLDFIVTSERLWGTHATVPELAITEVLRDPDLRAIALVHSRWDGRQRTELAA